MFIFTCKYIRYLAISLLLISQATSQTIERIKVEKYQGAFVFEQVGKKNDTLVKKESNRFYFLVPDSLKQNLVLRIDNGQIIKTTNDSIVVLNYLPSYKYEYIYQIGPSEMDAGTKIKGVYKTLINGVSSYPFGKILVQIYSLKKTKSMGEFIFYIKP
jgi:hypothetical protein